MAFYKAALAMCKLARLLSCAQLPVLLELFRVPAINYQRFHASLFQCSQPVEAVFAKMDTLVLERIAKIMSYIKTTAGELLD